MTWLGASALVRAKWQRCSCRTDAVVLGLIATACGDDAIRIFQEQAGSDEDAPTFELVGAVDRAHQQDVNCVAWSPAQAGLLASCSDDGDIKLWNVAE